MGNIEDAKVAVDIMARAIEDAVYLDEDAYNQMIPMQQYTRTIEVSFPCSPHAVPHACLVIPSCSQAAKLYSLDLPLDQLLISTALCAAHTFYRIGSQRGNGHRRWSLGAITASGAVTAYCATPVQVSEQWYVFCVQEQQRQILNLEHQLQNALHSAAQQKAAGQASRKRAVELQEELENNAAVFKLHYDELLAKDAEIAKLKAVIQDLSSGK